MYKGNNFKLKNMIKIQLRGKVYDIIALSKHSLIRFIASIKSFSAVAYENRIHSFAPKDVPPTDAT